MALFPMVTGGGTKQIAYAQYQYMSGSGAITFTASQALSGFIILCDDCRQMLTVKNKNNVDISRDFANSYRGANNVRNVTSCTMGAVNYMDTPLAQNDYITVSHFAAPGPNIFFIGII